MRIGRAIHQTVIPQSMRRVLLAVVFCGLGRVFRWVQLKSTSIVTYVVRVRSVSCASFHKPSRSDHAVLMLPAQFTSGSTCGSHLQNKYLGEFYYGLGHLPIQVPEAMKIPEARSK